MTTGDTSAQNGSGDAVELTVLNSMAGPDLPEQIEAHQRWGLRLMDLKDRILGKGIVALTAREAERAAWRIDVAGLDVSCLSTALFGGDLREGEAAFRERDLRQVSHAVCLARVLRPRYIRLLAAQWPGRPCTGNGIALLRETAPWLADLYRDAIDRIREAGFEPLIENEVGDCVLSRADEVATFFSWLDRRDAAKFVWDVQNLWSTGTFPSMSVYRELRPVIGMLHVKGGRSVDPGGSLRWASSLEDASWPVADIVRAAAGDGVSPVICLNPSHGEVVGSYRADTEHDLRFLRSVIAAPRT